MHGCTSLNELNYLSHMRSSEATATGGRGGGMQSRRSVSGLQVFFGAGTHVEKLYNNNGMPHSGNDKNCFGSFNFVCSFGEFNQTVPGKTAIRHAARNFSMIVHSER